jgi:hypothetical protein
MRREATIRAKSARGGLYSKQLKNQRLWAASVRRKPVNQIVFGFCGIPVAKLASIMLRKKHGVVVG